MAQKNDSRGANASTSRPAAAARADVLDAVGERVGQLEVGRGPGLLDVVAGDRDRVEPRHVRRGEREDVGDDPHRRRRRVDVGVADHELLEDVVLDGPGQLLGRDALLLGRHDVEREDRQHRAVHRHRHAHLVQRDAVEELAHVVDRVDRHTGHADVAGHPRVVAVVAAVGGQVERDRQALLPGGEVAPVERVGLLGGGEAGVLPDRPRLVDVHRRVGTAQVRRDAGPGLQEVQVGRVGAGVERRHDDALGGVPRQLVRALPGGLAEPVGPLLRGVVGHRQVAQVGVGEGRDAAGHAGAPRASRVRPSRSTASHPLKRKASTPACR